jgi:glycine cleavage system H protein
MSLLWGSRAATALRPLTVRTALRWATTSAPTTQFPGSDPAQTLYTRSHEWIKVDGNSAFLGITKHGVAKLGSITAIHLPEVGTACLTDGASCGSAENNEWAAAHDAHDTAAMVCIEGGDQHCMRQSRADLTSPVDGLVTEVNLTAHIDPKIVIADPEGKGWLVRLTRIGPPNTELMDAAAYEKYVRGVHAEAS